MDSDPREGDGRARLRGASLAGGLCLALWALGSAAFFAPRVERKLEGRARSALAIAGVPNGEVVAEGRKVVIEGRAASAELVERARRAVAEVPGVRAVEVRLEIAPETIDGARSEPMAGAPRPTSLPDSVDSTPEAGFATPEGASPAAEQVGGAAPAETEDLGDLRAELEGVIAGRRIAFARYGEDLTAEAEELVDDLARFLADHPAVRLEIGGHTDSRGGLERNLEISQRRADVVREQLIARGVDDERLRAVGYGPAAPIAQNDTEEGRRANRRVEFNIEERD